MWCSDPAVSRVRRAGSAQPLDGGPRDFDPRGQLGCPCQQLGVGQRAHPPPVRRSGAARKGKIGSIRALAEPVMPGDTPSFVRVQPGWLASSAQCRDLPGPGGCPHARRRDQPRRGPQACRGPGAHRAGRKRVSLIRRLTILSRRSAVTSRQSFTCAAPDRDHCGSLALLPRRWRRT